MSLKVVIEGWTGADVRFVKILVIASGGCKDVWKFRSVGGGREEGKGVVILAKPQQGGPAWVRVT